MRATTTVAAGCSATTWMEGMQFLWYCCDVKLIALNSLMRTEYTHFWHILHVFTFPNAPCLSFLINPSSAHFFLSSFLYPIRHFILDLVKRNIPFHEAIMNLPANATDFLDVFIGLYTRVGEDRYAWYVCIKQGYVTFFGLKLWLS